MREYLQSLARAEAYTGAASWPAAALHWQQVVARNPVNGTHWASLAEALFELGDYSGALAAYEKAQETGVWGRRKEIETMFPAEVAYRMATCHAGLGDRESAVRELGRALELGLRDLSRPLTDDHWEALRADGGVRELLGIIGTDGLSRDSAGARTWRSWPGRSSGARGRQSRSRTSTPLWTSWRETCLTCRTRRSCSG
jgi:tetratricopeptide (TPR) repeat protein